MRQPHETLRDGAHLIQAQTQLSELVGAARFELTTPCAQGRCATRLRYAPTFTALLILNHFANFRYCPVCLNRAKAPSTLAKPFKNPDRFICEYF